MKKRKTREETVCTVSFSLVKSTPPRALAVLSGRKPTLSELAAIQAGHDVLADEAVSVRMSDLRSFEERLYELGPSVEVVFDRELYEFTLKKGAYEPELLRPTVPAQQPLAALPERGDAGLATMTGDGGLGHWVTSGPESPPTAPAFIPSPAYQYPQKKLEQPRRAFDSEAEMPREVLRMVSLGTIHTEYRLVAESIAKRFYLQDYKLHSGDWDLLASLHAKGKVLRCSPSSASGPLATIHETRPSNWFWFLAALLVPRGPSWRRAPHPWSPRHRSSRKFG